MICFSHPTGNANCRAALQGLKDHNLLNQFLTTIAVYDRSILNKLSKIPFLHHLLRRKYDNSLRDYTSIQPWFELMRLFALKIKFDSLVKHESGFLCIDRIIEKLDKKTAKYIRYNYKNNLKAVYAYEDCALFSFLAAEQIGLKKIYELPIGYWRAANDLLSLENKRWPEWASTITSFKNSENKLRKKDLELEMADIVIVASKFTSTTINQYSNLNKSIHIIPYGFPDIYNGKRQYYDGNNRKLKLLYVGGLTQRKGIADIFSAVQHFPNDISLTIVGQRTTNQCKVLNNELRKHNYIPSLPHQKILELMRSHDVLLFPSLFEGFGLVITEAMSQGMPVITTDRTAGPDFINDGNNGWIIEAANTDSLINSIKNILDNPIIVEMNGRAAIQTASVQTWGYYSDSLISLLKNKVDLF